MNYEREGQRVSVCAVGSADNAVSFWTGLKERPLAVIKDIFKEHVLDISWNSLGSICIACSSDGSIAVAHFDEKDLGTPTQNTRKIHAEPVMRLVEDPMFLHAKSASQHSGGPLLSNGQQRHSQQAPTQSACMSYCDVLI